MSCNMTLTNDDRLTTIDDNLFDRYPLLARYAWIMTNVGYVRAGKHHLHVIIATSGCRRAPTGYEVHHVNQDKLDNRAENLVLLPRAVHGQLHMLLRPPTGASGYKGVTWQADHGKWRSYVKLPHRGKLVHLGYFSNINDAALAYNSAVQTYYPGLPAYLNPVGGS